MTIADHGATAATLILESRYLRASLRIEVSTAHHAFFVESHLSDLRKNAEELLPVALSTAGAQALRQILEEAEGLLLNRSSDDLSRATPILVRASKNDDCTTSGGQS